MGWTNYNARCYKKNGMIDRKAECDRQFHTTCEVVKSAMNGSTYWAAIRDLKDGRIWPVCILTRTSQDNSLYYNFWYKDIPAVDNDGCPNSVLNALPAYSGEDQYIEDWKARCRKINEHRNGPDSIRKLPIGSVIEFSTAWDKAPRQYTKMPPCYQFKTPFWLTDGNKYISKKRIPDDYVVVRRGLG